MTFDKTRDELERELEIAETQLELVQSLNEYEIRTHIRELKFLLGQLIEGDSGDPDALPRAVIEERRLKQIRAAEARDRVEERNADLLLADGWDE